jgi:hypothetical protein
VHPVTYRKIALVAGIIATGSACWSHPTLTIGDRNPGRRSRWSLALG